ncbi:MAG: hypothetical protein AB1397_05755 [bacterium]
MELTIDVVILSNVPSIKEFSLNSEAKRHKGTEAQRIKCLII